MTSREAEQEEQTEHKNDGQITNFLKMSGVP